MLAFFSCEEDVPEYEYFIQVENKTGYKLLIEIFDDKINLLGSGIVDTLNIQGRLFHISFQVDNPGVYKVKATRLYDSGTSTGISTEKTVCIEKIGNNNDVLTSWTYVKFP